MPSILFFVPIWLTHILLLGNLIYAQLSVLYLVVFSFSRYINMKLIHGNIYFNNTYKQTHIKQAELLKYQTFPHTIQQYCTGTSPVYSYILNLTCGLALNLIKVVKYGCFIIPQHVK